MVAEKILASAASASVIIRVLTTFLTKQYNADAALPHNADSVLNGDAVDIDTYNDAVTGAIAITLPKLKRYSKATLVMGLKHYSVKKVRYYAN